LWRQREKLDYESLEEAATQRDERQALGFYLELTASLAATGASRAGQGVFEMAVERPCGPSSRPGADPLPWPRPARSLRLSLGVGAS